MTQTTTYGPTRRSILQTTIIPVVMTLASLFLLGFALFKQIETPQENVWIVIQLGAMLIVIFGLLSMYWIDRYRNYAPLLLIDADGIVHGGSIFAFGRIPWSKIKGTRVADGDSFGPLKQKNLVIELADDTIWETLPSWKRALLERSIVLPDYELAAPIDTFQLALENHLHARRNQNRSCESTSKERVAMPLQAGR